MGIKGTLNALESIYATYPILLDDRIVYAIWFDGDYSGFNLTQSGEIAAFPSEAAAREFAIVLAKGLPIETTDLLNLDVCKKWMAKPSARSVNCSAFLRAYDAASDYRNSIARANLDLGDKSHLRVLDKLFWGCNLPAVTPKGKSYIPIWTKKEVKELRTMLEECIAVFEAKLSIQV